MKKTQLYLLFLILCISLIILASSVQSEDFAKGKLKKDKQVDVKENKIIEKAGKGKINFKNSFNVSVEDVDDSPNVYFSDNIVSVNTKELPELNQPATITLYDVDFETLPIIYYHEEFTTDSDEITEQCPEGICYNVNYDKESKTISFDVAHFSSYKIGEGSWPIKNSENIISSGKSLTIGLPYGLYYDQWQYYFYPIYDYSACPLWTLPMIDPPPSCAILLSPKCTQGNQIADDGVISYFPQGHSKLWGYLYIFDDDEYQFTTGSYYFYGPSYRSECFSSPDASRIIVEDTIAYTSEKTGGSGVPPCRDSLSSFAGSTLVRDWPGSSYGVDCMRDLSSIPLSKGFHQISAEAYSSYNYYGGYRLYVWKDYYPGISSPWTPQYAFLYKINDIKGSFETEWNNLAQDNIGLVELKNITVNATFNKGTVKVTLYMNDTVKNIITTFTHSFTSSSYEPEAITITLPPNTVATKIRYNLTLKAEDPLNDIKNIPVLHKVDVGYEGVDLSIARIEPVQVIEDANLVVNKPMIVRVFHVLASSDVGFLPQATAKIIVGYYDKNNIRYDEDEEPLTIGPILTDYDNYQIKSAINSFTFFGIKKPTQQGYINITAIIDPGENIAETNEKNNILIKLVNIGVQDMPNIDEDRIKFVYLPIQTFWWNPDADLGLFMDTVGTNQEFLRDVYPLDPTKVMVKKKLPFKPKSSQYDSAGILTELHTMSLKELEMNGITNRYIGVAPLIWNTGENGLSFPAGLAFLNGGSALIEAKPYLKQLAAHEAGHTFGLYDEYQLNWGPNGEAKIGELATDGLWVNKGLNGNRININEWDVTDDKDVVLINDYGTHYFCFMGFAPGMVYVQGQPVSLTHEPWVDTTTYNSLYNSFVRTA